jgi:ABC-type uncharacterized transport system permease subunit
VSESGVIARSPGQEPATRGGGSEPAGDGRGRPSLWRWFLDELWTANGFTVTALAIVLAMVIGGILIVVSTPELVSKYSYFFSRPTDALAASWDKVSQAYIDLFKGSVIDWETVRGWADGSNGWQQVFFPLTETLSYATPLIFTGLCVALAFRGGLFNIGAQGQAIMGVVCAGLTGFLIHPPVVIHLVLALLAGLAGGLVWGFIPGYLKARTGAHEVITTIMLNYVAILFLNWLIIQKGVQNPKRSDAISKDVFGSAKLPRLLGDNLRADLGIVVAILVTWAIGWLLSRSTFGFELRAVGANPDAARTAGMSVPRTVIVVMAIAGGLAGLGGSSLVLGTQANALTGTIVGNIGFDGILVALLGRVRPWGVMLAALLFGALRAGGNRMQSYSQISLELVTVLQALIVLFVAAPALVRAVVRLRAARLARLETTVAGW